jgi:hypothetical protein
MEEVRGDESEARAQLRIDERVLEGSSPNDSARN